ncbi:MAG: hypothetical protein EOP05_02615 [Proteobacteria bacterium]|nr:MAG: hypothetical protein EOP05_02615 [Pseudomonadota bacterium]
MISKFVLSTLSALTLSSVLSTAALAQETAPAATSPTAASAPTPVEQQRREEMMEKWRKQRFSFTLSPTYVNQSRDNINGAFTSNGFAAPRQDFTGYDMRFKHQWDNRFQHGIEYFAAGTDRDLGSNLANFEQEAFGIFFGYQPIRTERFSLSAGSGIGRTWSKVEVFSGAQNGRVEEKSWYAQPYVQAAFQISEGFGLGLTAAYMAPFDPSEKVVGVDLGARDIAVQGFVAKVDLILGRF